MSDGLTTQDSSLATVPTGSKIATDDAGASGHVQIVKIALSADGSASPISADADGLLVNLGANNDVSVTATNLDIRDLSSSSDSVAAAQLGTWNITDVSGTVSLPTGAATGAKQDTGNSSLATIAGAVAGTEMQVDVLTMPSVAVTNAGLTELAAAINASSQMDVNIAASGATVPVSNAGLTELAAAINGSSQMDVNIAAGSVTANAGTNLNTSALALEATLSSLNGKVTAVNTGAVTISAALPAGTNAIGKLAANNGVDIGDVDVASVAGNVTVVQSTATNLKTQAESYQGAAAVSITNPLFITNNPGTKNRYFYMLPAQVHVASANTVHWDLFNADAALVVRVTSILQIPDVFNAVTGITLNWLLERSTSVGTGGSALTAWLADTTATALDADITARSKPSGGAGQGTDLYSYILSAEETNTASQMIAAFGGLELVPPPLRDTGSGQGIVLRQNEGIRCVQVTSSNQGNTGWIIGFRVE